MLEELCREVDLIPESISYCSGFFSQRLSWLKQRLSKINPVLAWLVVLPFRIIPLLCDWWFTELIIWPYYSICIEAYKPRLEAY